MARLEIPADRGTLETLEVTTVMLSGTHRPKSPLFTVTSSMALLYCGGIC